MVRIVGVLVFNLIMIIYCIIQVDGIEFFYWEGGDLVVLVLVLLYGFLSFLVQYQGLMEWFEGCYYVIVFDYLGFGCSVLLLGLVIFDCIVGVIEGFFDWIGFECFSFYMFDFGVLVGFWFVVCYFECVQVFVLQNGNVYEEGFGFNMQVVLLYWCDCVGNEVVVCVVL